MTRPDTLAAARECALKIEDDLNDRSGFDLGSLDDEIHEEIRAKWSSIIASLLETREETARGLLRECMEMIEESWPKRPILIVLRAFLSSGEGEADE